MKSLPQSLIRFFYGLAMAKSHSLAHQTWVSLKQLTEQSWVLLPEGFPSRIMLEKRMQELGLSLSDLAHVEIVDSPSLVRAYLLQGHYVTFASDLDFQVERQAGLIQTVATRRICPWIRLYFC